MVRICKNLQESPQGKMTLWAFLSSSILTLWSIASTVHPKLTASLFSQLNPSTIIKVISHCRPPSHAYKFNTGLIKEANINVSLLRFP